MAIQQEQNSLTMFTDSTKQICMYLFVSLSLIIVFIISPFSDFYKTALTMKIVIVCLLLYTIQLNITQTKILTDLNTSKKYEHVNTQIYTNIISSYVFTLFLAILIIFVIKSFF